MKKIYYTQLYSSNGSKIKTIKTQRGEAETYRMTQCEGREVKVSMPTSYMGIGYTRPCYRRDHSALHTLHSKFWYPSKFTVALCGFHCDSNAFELNNSINHGKITVLNISIYRL